MIGNEEELEKLQKRLKELDDLQKQVGSRLYSATWNINFNRILKLDIEAKALKLNKALKENNKFEPLEMQTLIEQIIQNKEYREPIGARTAIEYLEESWIKYKPLQEEHKKLREKLEKALLNTVDTQITTVLPTSTILSQPLPTASNEPKKPTGDITQPLTDPQTQPESVIKVVSRTNSLPITSIPTSTQVLTPPPSTPKNAGLREAVLEHLFSALGLVQRKKSKEAKRAWKNVKDLRIYTDTTVERWYLDNANSDYVSSYLNSLNDPIFFNKINSVCTEMEEAYLPGDIPNFINKLRETLDKARPVLTPQAPISIPRRRDQLKELHDTLISAKHSSLLDFRLECVEK